MPPLGFHVTLRLADDRPLASSAADRRLLASTVLEAGDPHGLFVFFGADTHLHAGLACTRAAAGRFCQRVTTALRARLGLDVAFEPARVRPFRDAWHRYNAVRYVLRQPGHHGLPADPFHEAGNLPDLLGLRTTGAGTLDRLRALCPRLAPGDLATAAGLPAFYEEVVAEHLAEATLAAAALPSLGTKDPRTRAAEAAAVAAARDALGIGGVADALGLSRATAYRLAQVPADPALVRAIRLQMGLRAAVAAANAASSATDSARAGAHGVDTLADSWPPHSADQVA